ncbi:MAG: DUF2059 domain-containing protein [Candidatus Sulfotelmatobacter sp.]
MKRVLIALACLAFIVPAFAQTAEEPASRDDVILYLRTMRSHDLMQRTMQVQLQSMQQLMHDQILKEKGKVPANFDAQFKKGMDDLLKNMPMDEVVQAMIPAYQKHFTHGDIEAMNAFYSSPVGQKVLEELPAVMQEGMQAAMPILSKYLSEAHERMKRELEPAETSTPASTEGSAPPAQN